MTHRRLTSLAAAVVLLALAAVHPQSPPLPSGASDKTATVFGSKIRYLDAGSGPAVVLLHGLGGDSSHWAPTIGPCPRSSASSCPIRSGSAAPTSRS